MRHRAATFVVVTLMCALSSVSVSQVVEGIDASSPPTFEELLHFTNEVLLSLPDSSHLATLGPYGLGAHSKGFVVADGLRREIFWFSSRGELQAQKKLDTLGGPQCMSGLKVSVPEAGDMVAIYDGLTNSAIGIDRHTMQTTILKMSDWRVDSWASRAADSYGIGLAFKKDPQILLKSFDGHRLHTVCDITHVLKSRRSYGQTIWDAVITGVEDGGFLVLQGNSFTITKHASDGSLLRTSTRIPQGFKRMTEVDSIADRTKWMEDLKHSSSALSIVTSKGFVLVGWVDVQTGKAYLTILDSALKILIQKVPIPQGLIPYLYTAGGSIYLRKVSDTNTCGLPGADPSIGGAGEPLKLNRYELVESLLR